MTASSTTTSRSHRSLCRHAVFIVAARRRHVVRRRRAVVLVAVLVCLMIVGLLAGSLAKTILSDHRRQTRVQQAQQADWLARSGLQRAVSRLRASEDYAGETWQVTLGEGGEASAGRVVIRVAASDQQVQQRRIEVEASYPDGSSQPLQSRHELVVSLAAPADPTP